MERPLTPIHQAEVDGVPAFWAESPGPFTAGLVFRVGRVDERLHISGITHLVEHLALPAWMPKPGLDWNGWVSLTTTGFWASGDPAGVTAFIGEVTRQIHDLPLDRLETEKGILRAEEASAGRSIMGVLAGLRFGAVGIALLDWNQLGLRTLDGDRVAAWARERFTSGNAALWLSGPPPSDLRLHLPPGSRNPPPRWEPPPESLPAYSRWGYGGVALSLFAPRSYALGLAWIAAEHRATRRLRYEHGLIYSLSASNNPPDRHDANVVFVAECTEQNVDAVREGLLKVLNEIATEGPSEEERHQWLSMTQMAARDPNEAASMAALYAEDLLLDDPRTNEEVLAEMEAVTTLEAAAAMREALSTALLLIPEEGAEAPPPPFREFKPAEPTLRIDGRRFAPRSLKGRLGRQGHTIVGDEGIAWQSPEGKQVAIAFDRCEVVMTWEDGAVQLIDTNGTVITVVPGALREGDDAVAAIRRAVAREYFVPMD